jgi:hypothetical protein
VAEASQYRNGLPFKKPFSAWDREVAPAEPALLRSGSVAHFLGARVFRRKGNMPQCEQLIHSSWWIVEADLEAMTVMTFSFAVRTFIR